MRSDIKKNRCLKRKKKPAHLQFDNFFFSAVSLPRLTDIIIYTTTCLQLCKSRFLPKLSCFPLLLFLFISQFFCTREQRDLPWFLQAMPRTTPSRPPLATPAPLRRTPKWPPSWRKKNVHNYSAVDDLFSGSWFLSMPYNARAKQKKVQLSALIVCLRGIFEDKYYELSQKPKKCLCLLTYWS